MADCFEDARDPANWYLAGCVRAFPPGVFDSENVRVEPAAAAALRTTADAEVGRDDTGLGVLASCRADLDTAGPRLCALMQSCLREPSRLPRLRDAGYLALLMKHIIETPWAKPSLYVR